MRLSLPRPPLVDVLIAVFYAAVVVVEALTEAAVANPGLHAVAGGAAMLLLAWRRSHTLLVVVGVEAALVVLGANGSGMSLVFALVVMGFTVGSETEGRRSWVGLLLLVMPFSLALFIELREAAAGDVGAIVTFIVIPWLAGRVLRQRAAHLAEARSHAERLELEREHEAERAAERERVRLARELHDVVSHSISVIAIQAQAVRRRLPAEQQREIDDLAGIESAAREAMAEMRRLFGVLREAGQDPALSPQPGLGELGALLDRVRATGLQVDVETTGEPVTIPTGLDLAAYRIVQEALTNAMRHSGGTRVRVTVAHHPEELELIVDDDGRGVAVTVPANGAGHGLRGIRERAELYGGTLSVQDGPLGGTRVRALLPVGGEAGELAMSPGGAVSVVIADDQAMVRAGFRSLLEAEAGIEVVGEAADGEQACAVVAQLDPDVVLMDIRMPVLDGLAATRRLAEQGARCRVLVLTTFDLDEYVFAALRAGASGFLLKDAPGRAAGSLDPRGRGRGVPARPGGHPAGDRRLRGPRAGAGRADRPAAGGPDTARAGGAGPARPRPEQHPDRARAVHLRGDHQDPREQRAVQAAPERPGAGGDRGLRVRPGDTWHRRRSPTRLSSGSAAPPIPERPPAPGRP